MKIIRFVDDRMTNTFLIPRDTILDTDPTGRNLKVVFFLAKCPTFSVMKPRSTNVLVACKIPISYQSTQAC